MLSSPFILLKFFIFLPTGIDYNCFRKNSTLQILSNLQNEKKSDICDFTVVLKKKKKAAKPLLEMLLDFPNMSDADSLNVALNSLNSL